MYACMHLHMYACMHVCMHACMHVYMYACMHVYMYACMHACMHVCAYVCVYVCRLDRLGLCTAKDREASLHAFNHPRCTHPVWPQGEQPRPGDA